MNIKILRKQRGLTQEELSNATGIPRGRIAQWELGKANPRANDYKILQEYFKNEYNEASNIIQESSEKYYTNTDATLSKIDNTLKGISVSLAQSETRDNGIGDLLRFVINQIQHMNSALQTIQDTLNKTVGAEAHNLIKRNSR